MLDGFHLSCCQHAALSGVFNHCPALHKAMHCSQHAEEHRELSEDKQAAEGQNESWNVLTGSEKYQEGGCVGRQVCGQVGVWVGRCVGRQGEVCSMYNFPFGSQLWNATNTTTT